MRRFMPVARFGLLFFGFSTVVIGLHWLLGDKDSRHPQSIQQHALTKA